MSDGSGRGFVFSATLHGIIAALMFFGFVFKRDDVNVPKVFELVAGEGDNYMAREAPALGTPGGVSVEMPSIPEPKRAQPEPATREVTAPAPAPRQPEPTVPDFKKQIRRELIVAESKAKLQIKKQRAAEAKRQRELEAKQQREAEVKKQREAEAKKQRENDDDRRMTKEEFDRANASKSKSKPSTSKSAPVKVAKIDAEGIAKGVVGGSTANKVGGAGGKALKADHDDVLAAYDALFKQRLRAEFEPPPGLSDSLKAEIEVRSNADGSLTAARVVKSSGSAEFDRAVLDAVRRVRMPDRPDRKSETIAFTFTMRERE